MSDTNYIGAIVKVLETPQKKSIRNNIWLTKFRAQLPQVRQTRIVNLVIWGNLGNDIAKYYNTNDYLLIEGYLSVRNSSVSKSSQQPLKKIQITVLKAYPFLLNSNRLKSKS